MCLCVHKNKTAAFLKRHKDNPDKTLYVYKVVSCYKGVMYSPFVTEFQWRVGENHPKRRGKRTITSVLKRNDWVGISTGYLHFYRTLSTAQRCAGAFCSSNIRVVRCSVSVKDVVAIGWSDDLVAKKAKISKEDYKKTMSRRKK